MTTFLLTFERITHESAALGDAAEDGILYEGISLREGIDELRNAECIEANEYPLESPRWVTAYGAPDIFIGDRINISLHFPSHLTPSTRRRIVRLLTKVSA